MSEVKIPIRKFVAPEIVFGQGARRLAGQYAADLGGSKVLVVTDAKLSEISWMRDIMTGLQKTGLEYVTFSEVSPNPRTSQVRKGTELYLKERCDLIMAVGGGSPMDCAKAIGASAMNGMDPKQFEGVDAIPSPGPPLICVPTTSGSSADVSQFAIISDEEKKRKFAIVSKIMVPDMSLLDPEVTVTMGPKLTAATGMDALVHAIEAYVSTASSPMTDLYAREAISMVTEWLPKAIRQGDDTAVRGNMMLASMYAGLAFSNASLGLVHAMAHSLGGQLDAVHGECNAVLLEHVVRFNYPQARDRYDQAKALMQAASPLSGEDLADVIRSFTEAVGMIERLSDLGVKRSDIPALAKNTIDDPCMATNPRKASLADIEKVFESAL